MYHLTIVWLAITAASYLAGRYHGRRAARERRFLPPPGDL